MAIPIKCFVSHRPVSCDGGSVGRAKKKKRMNTLRGLGSFKKPGDTEPKDFVSVDLAENVGTIVYALGTKQPLKNLLSIDRC